MTKTRNYHILHEMRSSFPNLISLSFFLYLFMYSDVRIVKAHYNVILGSNGATIKVEQTA